MLKDIGGKYQDFKLNKADGTPVPDDEPVFILRAQDVLAPHIVRLYANLYGDVTGDARHARELNAVASAMSAWPDRKIPD